MKRIRQKKGEILKKIFLGYEMKLRSQNVHLNICVILMALLIALNQKIHNFDFIITNYLRFYMYTHLCQNIIPITK